MPRDRRRSSRSPYRRGRSPSPRRYKSTRRSRSPRRSPRRSRSSRSPNRDFSRNRHSPHRRNKSPPSRRRSTSRTRRESSPHRSRRSRSPKSRRSRSPVTRRDSGNQTNSYRCERPEIREAESSTHGPSRSDHRDERRSPRRRSRSSGPRKSRSPVQREERDRHRGSSSPSDKKNSSKKVKGSSEELVLREDISKHTKRKRTMLCERFAETDQEPFEPQENITIGIERSIRGNSPAVIRKEIKPEAVELPRRKDEGSVPFAKREEFKTREEVTEKRVIKLIEDPTRHRDRRSRSRSRNRGRDLGVDKIQVVRRDDTYRNQELEEKYSYLNERQTGGRYDKGDDRRPDRRRYPTDPHDLRFSLTTRRDRREDIRSRLGVREDRGRDKDMTDNKNSQGELPDFKQRPDKGKYAEWTINPEQIPKSIRYFEHDNRGEQDYWYGRGRGRGFRGRFRGRGRGFGMSRGRGNRSLFGTSEGEWLHDKFAEIEGQTEGEDDDKPSSTTEK